MNKNIKPNIKPNIKLRLKFIILSGLSFMTVLFYQNCSPMSSQKDQSAINALSATSIVTQKAIGVMSTRCLSCHSTTIKSGGIDVLNINDMLAIGVVVPNEPSLSTLFTSIQNGRMPPAAGMTQDEIQAIFDWIQEGFATPPVVVNPTTGTTTPLTASYASINANILNSKCVGCHNSSNSSGGISYSNYTATMNTVVKNTPASSALYTAVAVRNTMPKGGLPLSAAESKAISDWILAGAPNN